METTAGKTLNVRPIPPTRKHPAIFDTFDELETGDHYVLVNDHDPRRVYCQFEDARPGEMAWADVEEGPDLSRVRLTKSEQTS